MKKLLIDLAFFLAVVFFLPSFVLGQTPTPGQIAPKAYTCPPELDQIYQQINTGEKCTTNYEEFKTDPKLFHYWTDDEEVTMQGRAKERARQFIDWVMNHSSIDNHPVLLKVWSTARNVSYFFVILTAALLGLGIIIGQRTNFDTGVKVWPSVIKILTSILYIAFSATIVISIIQLSDVMMKFFIENLGGKDLFNIYFNIGEKNYFFFGIKDLNMGAQESIKTQLFILKLTEITYYILGGMLILRKIILWFLLFVSPFLPILFSFSLIKNVGWIWIRVFFQWVFYGPLFALFLGALATIWKAGIPFIFDFSRHDIAAGYIYPTATNILWGGPAQKLTSLNNINYIDPYVEYIITLIMLWAVTFFPWWLLRTYLDYCCEGISAIKNLLLSNFGPGRNPPSPGPTLSPVSLTTNLGAALKIPKEVETSMKTRIETVEEIKKAETEEIVHSLDMRATKITDVARFETNKTTNETFNKNINYLKNPTQATTINERQKYMNIRVELSNRAAKADPLAGRIVSSVFAPALEQVKNRAAIINTLPKMAPVTQMVSFRVKLPEEKVRQVSSSITNMVVNKKDIIETISQKTGVTPETTTRVINMLHQNINTPATEMVQKISNNTNLEREKVSSVIKEFSTQVKSNTKIIEAVAKENNLNSEQVNKVIDAQAPVISVIPQTVSIDEYEQVKSKLMDQYENVAEPGKNIEQNIVIPQTVSIDEYEQVKKMWMDQYEKGEVPITENIKTRDAWVEKDIVIITNTLNKLLSENVELKQEGLDEVGYILPIFIVNNLNGEQLITYLKAKIEAAKTVKELSDKEKEITEKLKSKSETVDVLKPKKKEAEKTIEMKKELKENLPN
ncbi:hypothetical protein CO049_02400 [Candidatus Roizmanbacteria bacterium CG_4_9_14_0_2_um_filter_36_12]|uniref:Uncharacterized protein n=3 Tax=Candidatus Roizmaniibacteriota TaxID=1752723 RepID=A0A2M8EZZ6_9BACT|nr:MAG: hypothetical protein CO049_02400 [Candidatus Roizmanbacteria bacterium CG_4_9_14_0_2_um_filter_36_12]